MAETTIEAGRVGAKAARPALAALRRDAALHLAVAALLAGGLAAAVAALAPLTAGYPLRVLAPFAVAAALVWHALPAHAAADGTAHTRFGPANRVTLGRLVLVLALAATAGAAPSAALGWGLVVVATVAALLDALDGALARRSGLASPFGARFDMETDALLILVLALLLWQLGRVPAWVLAAGAMRYAFVAAAAAWPWLARPLPPSVRRQAVCVVQIVLLIVALGPIVPPALATALAALGLTLLAWSFAVDVAWLARRRPTPHPEPDARHP